MFSIRPFKFTTSIFVLLSLFAFTCGKKESAHPEVDADTSRGPAMDQTLNMTDAGELRIDLSAGKRGNAKARAKLAKTSPMSKGDTKTLLGRLPKLKQDTTDKKSFALRERSLPAPKSGKTIQSDFPPAQSEQRPESENKELEVLRVTPEGDVEIAPHLTITFNQAMVPLSGQEDVVKDLPVTISPKPAGQWQWLGAKTLMFRPEGRLPMATKFKVTIPKTMKSESGQSLSADKTIHFSTPPIKIEASYPHDGTITPLRLDPITFLRFNQRIAADKLIDSIHFEAKGKTIPAEIVSLEAVKADKYASRFIETNDETVKKRGIFIRPSRNLPTESNVSIVVKKGASSAEGSLKTTTKQQIRFETYSPLRIRQRRCGWGECRPGMNFTFEFNNPLDSKQKVENLVHVTPEIPHMRVSVSGVHLSIHGQTKARQTYKVRIKTDLRDEFGQSLVREIDEKFEVGDLHPTLFATQPFVIADPTNSKKTFSFHSYGTDAVRYEVYQVTPKDWDAFRKYREGNPRAPKPAPGRLVDRGEIQVDRRGVSGELFRGEVSLDKALNRNKKGHAVVYLTPKKWPHPRYKPEFKTWVQVSDIGMDAFMDQNKLMVWTNELKNGDPAADVRVRIGEGTSAISNNKGIAELPAPNGATGLLIAERGDDVAFYPPSMSPWHAGSWHRPNPGSAERFFVFDDRGMYKPGETVHLKGWVRHIDFGVEGDVNRSSVRSLSYQVRGTRGNDLTKGSVNINEFGGFDLKFDLPKTANLGHATITFSGSAYHSHSFQIQEFRRPEYEVTTTTSQGPHILGKRSTVSAKAAYYSGGGLANAKTNWLVTATPSSYTPPGHDTFTFGQWKPYWFDYWFRGPQESGAKTFQMEEVTNSKGETDINLDIVSLEDVRPLSVKVEAQVQDLNRQTWASAETLLIHPSENYVGLRSERSFINKGEDFDIETVVVRQDGTQVASTVKMELLRESYRYEDGEYKSEEEVIESCDVKSAEESVEKCTFSMRHGGSYRIRATTHDTAGRQNESELRFWVRGGKLPPKDNVEVERVLLVPNQDEYEVGDTAEIFVQSPFYPAEALLTVRRGGIVSSRRVHLTEDSEPLKVKIAENNLPNLHVEVDVLGETLRSADSDAKRPAYGSGTLNLRISKRTRKLSVNVRPDHKGLMPGGKTKVHIEVRDSNNQPAAHTEVAAFVVDEAVLALSGYQTPNPIPAFYPDRGAGVSEYHNREYLRLAKPPIDTNNGEVQKASFGARGRGAGGGGAPEEDMVMDEAEAMPMAAAPMPKKSMKRRRSPGNKDVKQPAIAIRKNFAALALFVGSAKTNAHGKVALDVKLPDNLTRYRVMAVAADDVRRFGSGESQIVARKPLMLRPSAPRFLNYGDNFEFPLLVQNQSEKKLTVNLAMRASNLTLKNNTGQKLTLAPKERVEVRFPAKSEMAGTARYQIAVSAGSFSDAVEGELPVWTPATTESFASYGVIDREKAISQGIKLPNNSEKNFGGLQVTTSSTQLQALSDAFLYLVHYPYECSEQSASRILSIVALKDVLREFNVPDMPSEEELAEVVNSTLRHLQGLQNGNGGFAYWVRGRDSIPYNSIHVAHALARAKEAGYDVPSSMLSRVDNYLDRIEQHIPYWYSKRSKRTLRAYAYYIRTRLGHSEGSRVKSLLGEVALKEHSMESLGWMLHALKNEKDAASKRKILKHLNNRVSETAGAANFTTSFDDKSYTILQSSRRTDAVILEALIANRSQEDLIPKLIRGLLAHQKKGRWGNTQENVFVLLGIYEYFEAYEKITPSFAARIWLGDRFAAEHKFKGRSVDQQELNVPMSYLAEKSDIDKLHISKEGRGRLYYRLAMNYAPSSLKLDPADYGFAVKRTFEAVDDKDDVRKLDNGEWEIKAGAKVRVRLTMVAVNRRYHVALVDPLAAGLEAMNPALKTTPTIPKDPTAKPVSRYWWWFGTWYEHQNMRDERVEAFASLLPAGVHEYTYVAQATTPGRFVVPPTKAEEMYSPETFGRSASDIIHVK